MVNNLNISDEILKSIEILIDSAFKKRKIGKKKDQKPIADTVGGDQAFYITPSPSSHSSLNKSYGSGFDESDSDDDEIYIFIRNLGNGKVSVRTYTFNEDNLPVTSGKDTLEAKYLSRYLKDIYNK